MDSAFVSGSSEVIWQLAHDPLDPLSSSSQVVVKEQFASGHRTQMYPGVWNPGAKGKVTNLLTKPRELAWLTSSLYNMGFMGLYFSIYIKKKSQQPSEIPGFHCLGMLAHLYYFSAGTAGVARINVLVSFGKLEACLQN